MKLKFTLVFRLVLCRRLLQLGGITVQVWDPPYREPFDCKRHRIFQAGVSSRHGSTQNGLHEFHLEELEIGGRDSRVDSVQRWSKIWIRIGRNWCVPQLLNCLDFECKKSTTQEAWWFIYKFSYFFRFLLRKILFYTRFFRNISLLTCLKFSIIYWCLWRKLQVFLVDGDWLKSKHSISLGLFSGVAILTTISEI